MVSQCFICSKPRHELDRNGGGFDKHVKHGLRGDHCMWNYLFFLLYLGQKEKTDYDAMEAYVARCVENRQTHWVPINRAICLDDYEDQEDAEEANSLEARLQDHEDRIHEKFRRNARKRQGGIAREIRYDARECQAGIGCHDCECE